MPVERVSKGFKDLSMTFQVSPLNYDLMAIKNETAIARSIRNLVLTLPGERFFNQNLGSNVGRTLFENINDLSSSVIRDQIRETIDLYEPRVRLTNVTTSPDYDNNGYDVTIEYEIVGIDVLPQQLSFALQQTR